MAIIKCPDCSSTISSQVYTCPNCGRRIKGYVRQCPKCEEWVSADNPVCPLCENVVDNSAIAKEIKDDKDLSFTSHRQPRKRKSGKGCLIAFFFLLMLLLAVAISYVFQRYQEHRLAEKKTIQEELTRRIAEGAKANEAQLLLMQADSNLWAKTFKKKSIEATEKYIDTYPEGIFINEAYMLLDELKRRKVTDIEHNRIRNIVEGALAEERKRKLKNKENDVLGLHLQIEDNLSVTKKYLNRDSFHYVVKAKVLTTISRTDPKKDNKEHSRLEIILDSNCKIIQPEKGASILSK